MASDTVKGGEGGKFLFGLSLALLLKSQFSSVDLRTTTVCPTGDKAENTIRIFRANDPDFHCLPLTELAQQFIMAPLVFPGDADWDNNLIAGPRGLRISKPIR